MDARSILPKRLHHAARRFRHRLLISRGRFRSPEPEWDRLSEWLRPGDITIDVGANCGFYTARMSELVGPFGRVVAIEPVLETFALLVANALHFPYPNATFLNLAASDQAVIAGLSVPDLSGYLAHLDSSASLQCLAVPLDALSIPGPIRFLKIDAEGHEAEVLRGAAAMVASDRPIIVYEKRAAATDWLQSIGYHVEKSAQRSPNLIAMPPDFSGSTWSRRP